MASFQTQVGVQPAVAVVGDWADGNPRSFYTAGAGGLVAGPGGLTIGRFAWVTGSLDQSNGAQVAQNTGTGIGGFPWAGTATVPVAGFVHREQTALIKDYLAEYGNTIVAGRPVTLTTRGSVWAINSGASLNVIGQKAYANFLDGKVTFAAASSANTVAYDASYITATAVISVTGSITGGVLTVTAVSAGSLYNGAILTGSGVATGTMITEQLSGTPLGVGTYAVSIGEQAVASTTISGSYGLMTIAGNLTGTGNIGIGSIITGTSVTSGTYVTAFGTGTGGAGTYIVTPSQTRGNSGSPITITATTNVETNWYAMSAGGAGEMVKMTTHWSANG